MAAERLAPDAVLNSGNYTTLNLGDIDEDPDSPDGTFGTWDGNGNTDARVSFGTPATSPTTGAGLQEFRVQIRKSSSGGNSATWSLELWENGVIVGSALATGTVTSTTGVVVSGTWNASSLGTSDGSLVECALIQTGGATGTPGNRRAVEVGAFEWNATVDASSTNVAMPVASAAFDAPALTEAPGSVNAALTPASAAFDAPAITEAPAAATAALTPASAAFDAPAMTSVATSLVAMPVASATFDGPALTSAPGSVSIPLATASATFDGPAMTPAPGSVDAPLAPASATFDAPVVTASPQATTAALTPASASFDAPEITPSSSILVALTTASASFDAPALTPAPGSRSAAIIAALADLDAPALDAAPGSVDAPLAVASAAFDAPAMGSASVTFLAMAPASASFDAPAWAVAPGATNAAVPLASAAFDAPALVTAPQPMQLSAAPVDAVADVPIAAIFDPSLVMASAARISNEGPAIAGTPAAPNPNPGNLAGVNPNETDPEKWIRYWPRIDGKKGPGWLWQTTTAGHVRAPRRWRDAQAGGLVGQAGLRDNQQPSGQTVRFGKIGKADNPFGALLVFDLNDPPIPVGSTITGAVVSARVVGAAGGAFNVSVHVVAPDGIWDAAPTTGYANTGVPSFGANVGFTSKHTVQNNIMIRLKGATTFGGGVGDGAHAVHEIERLGFVGTAQANGNLTNCTFRIGRVGNPSGDVTVEIYAVSGLLPTGAPLRTSAKRSAMGINNGGGGGLETFTFSSLAITSGTKYAFVIRTTYEASETNFLQVHHQQSPPAQWGTTKVDFDGLVYGVKEQFTFSNYRDSRALPLPKDAVGGVHVAAISNGGLLGGGQDTMLDTIFVLDRYYSIGRNGIFGLDLAFCLQGWIDHVSYVPGQLVCIAFQGTAPGQGHIGIGRSIADPILAINWQPPLTNYQLTADPRGAQADAPASTDSHGVARLTAPTTTAVVDAPAATTIFAGLVQIAAVAATAAVDAPAATDSHGVARLTAITTTAVVEAVSATDSQGIARLTAAFASAVAQAVDAVAVGFAGGELPDGVFVCLLDAINRAVLYDSSSRTVRVASLEGVRTVLLDVETRTVLGPDEGRSHVFEKE